MWIDDQEYGIDIPPDRLGLELGVGLVGLGLVLGLEFKLGLGLRFGLKGNIRQGNSPGVHVRHWGKIREEKSTNQQPQLKTLATPLSINSPSRSDTKKSTRHLYDALY